jgi:hypothetical protein
MLVPLRRRYLLYGSVLVETRALGSVWYRVFPDQVTAVSAWPGATTSGFVNPSYHVGPRELYAVMASSDRVVVPLVSNAPTVIADGALPGDAMPA